MSIKTQLTDTDRAKEFLKRYKDLCEEFDVTLCIEETHSYEGSTFQTSLFGKPIYDKGICIDSGFDIDLKDKYEFGKDSVFAVEV